MTLIRVDDGPTTHLAEFDTLTFDDNGLPLKQRIRLAWNLVRGGEMYVSMFSINIDESRTEPVVVFHGIRLGVRR